MLYTQLVFLGLNLEVVISRFVVVHGTYVPIIVLSLKILLAGQN